MGYEDQLITKETVILDKPSDWTKWLFLRKDSADRNGVWEYCNPELTAETVKDITKEKPVDKTFRSFKRNAGIVEPDQPDIEIYELEDDEYGKWQRWHSIYAGKLASYEKRERALAEMNREISRTIASRHITSIQDDSTPYARLVTLKKLLSPSNSERRFELLERYEKIKRVPKRGNMDDWFEEYITILREMIRADLSDIKDNRAQQDFLREVQGLDPAFATHWQQQLIEAELDEKEFLGPVELVQRFQRHRRGLKPVAASLGTYAVFSPPNSERREITCLCGNKHRFQACPYVNSSLRSANWRPDPRIEARFQEVRDKGKSNKMARILWGIEHGRGNGSSSASQSSPSVNLDSGEPPSSINGNMNQAISWLGTNAAAEEPVVIASSAAPTLTNAAIRHSYPPLINRWILDPGTNVHVTNHRHKSWQKIRDGNANDVIAAGTQYLQIEEWGKVELAVETPSGDRRVVITWVAYIPSFFTSCVALSRCRDMGFEFDSGRKCLYKRDHRSAAFCLLRESDGHWLMDADTYERPQAVDLYNFAVQARMTVKPSYRERKPLELTQAQAHQLLGHASRRAIENLESAVDGIKIVEGAQAPKWKECEDCVGAKLSRMISRRPPREPASRPFERIGVDLIQLRKRGESCYNGDKWLLHFVDQYSKWHEARSLENKRKDTLTKAVEQVLAKFHTQYGARVKYVKCDNETGFADLWDVFADLGLTVEPRVVGAPEMSGMAERAGDAIMTSARATRLSAQLPKTLANELALTAVYLLNRTPTESLDWKTPYQVVRGIKPTLAHLNAIGAKALFRNVKVPRGDKLESKAITGWLVGYDGTNIFRVWVPSAKQVIRTRDVVFMSGERYEPTQSGVLDLETRRAIQVLDIESDEEYEDAAIEQLRREARAIPPRRETAKVVRLEESQERGGDEAEDQLRQEAGEGLHTSQKTPILGPETSTPGTLGMRTLVEDSEEGSDSGSVSEVHEHIAMPRGWREVEPGAQMLDRRHNNAPRRRNPDIDASNVVQGSRRRGGENDPNRRPNLSAHYNLYY